jgi:hypothetical protein
MTLAQFSEEYLQRCETILISFPKFAIIMDDLEPSCSSDTTTPGSFRNFGELQAMTMNS